MIILPYCTPLKWGILRLFPIRHPFSKSLCTWQFFVTFLGWLSDPYRCLSDLQLGDENVTLNHLVYIMLSYYQHTILSLHAAYMPLHLSPFPGRIQNPATDPRKTRPGRIRPGIFLWSETSIPQNNNLWSEPFWCNCWPYIYIYTYIYIYPGLPPPLK